MKFNDVKEILETSSQDDWIVDYDTESFTYKDELNLRIERAENDDDNIFNEPWATNHSNKYARTIDYIVKYGFSFIKEYRLVSVDGHRALLPMPTIGTNFVKKTHVNFAKIVCNNQSVDEYLKRSGLIIEE